MRRWWQKQPVRESDMNMLPLVINSNSDSLGFENRHFDIPGMSIAKMSEAATRGVLWKKALLKISQNAQENTCAKVSFLIKLRDSGKDVFMWILQNF